MATGIEKLLFFKKKSFLNKEFKKYNDNFKPNLTKFDWLTRDENEVKKYEESEFADIQYHQVYLMELWE